MSESLLGKNIKYLRLLNNETQNSIGLKMKKGQKTIGNWETDFSEPNTKELIFLSNLFEYTVDDLLKNDFVKGGDLPIKQTHKLHSKGGDNGGDEGGDWQLNEDAEPHLKQSGNQYNSTYFLRTLLEEKTATIADLRERVNELKAYNATLNKKIEELTEMDQITSKRKVAG